MTTTTDPVPSDTTRAPLAVVGAVYEAFGRGDMASVLDALADDVDWSSDIDPNVDRHDTVPIRRHGVGKAAAIDYFTAIGRDVEFHRFEPEVLASSGHDVFARISVDLTIRPTGKRIEFLEIHNFSVRHGLIVRFRSYFDTAMFIWAYAPR